MSVSRVIEVWDTQRGDRPVAYWPVADTIPLAFLLRLFGPEQRIPDPDMLLSYLLDARKVAALQPYVAQQMEISRYDFVLTGQLPRQTTAEASADDEPFD